MWFKEEPDNLEDLQAAIHALVDRIVLERATSIYSASKYEDLRYRIYKLGGTPISSVTYSDSTKKPTKKETK